MKALRFIARWLDIRPNEGREVILSILGSFLLLAFVVLARSMREASYLTAFGVRALPYITAGAVCLTLPAVGLFTRLLGSRSPWKVVRVLLLLLGAGLGALWALALWNPVGIVLFYLWAAVGALLLTSGFWVLAAETFALRGAKRLFSLIIAGGTMGTVVMGLSLDWVTKRLEMIWLGPLLMAILLLFFVVESLLWRASPATSGVEGDGSPGQFPSSQTVSFSVRDNVAAIWDSPYLRTMALILLGATLASTIVDYQFKEFAQAYVGTGSELTGFLGAFYGWTGGLALLMQLLVAARILSSGGVVLGLVILPLMLLLGSSAFLVAPGLVIAILLRGGDFSLRKSLLRPMMEFLYVPLSAAFRRRTKSFIDVVVDSTGEGAGALVWFLLVNLIGFSSRSLAALVAGISIYLIILSRRMGRLYLDEIVRRLRDPDTGPKEVSLGEMLNETHLLTASYSHMDLQGLLGQAADFSRAGSGPGKAPSLADEAGDFPGGTPAPGYGPAMQKRSSAVGPEPEESIARDAHVDTLTSLRSPNNELVLRAVQSVDRWDEDHIRALTSLLVRNAVRETAVTKLLEIGDPAVGVLSEVLIDESADFVVRRRIPRALAGIGGGKAEKALYKALHCRRFEVRYRAAIALVRLMKRGLLKVTSEGRPAVWGAVKKEVETNRPVWEMQKLLDDFNVDEEDELVARRVGVRGELSLEHTFRMLTLVLDPDPVRAAFHGIVLDDGGLKSFALEYLEQVLPADIRERLWLFIGDVSEYRKAEELRSIDRVVSDLMSSRATLFGGERERDALKKLLKDRDDQ